MATPGISVVIPTHKRAGILARCLEHLERQTIADRLEAIVVSDGHDPDTAAMIRSRPAGALRVRFIEIPKSQQGIARNRGVEEAAEGVVLFLGDDAFLAPDACERHLLAHSGRRAAGGDARKPLAVLGFTTWDPAVGITPAMRWLEKTGWQFGYPLLEPYRHAFVPAEIQHRFTYTINISVPAEIARAHPFRSDVSLYGWEDILWGMALREAGVPLFYEPDARALHHHRVTLEDSLRRMHTLGRSLAHISAIAPELDRMPTGLKLLAYRLIALTPAMRGRHYRAFLAGLTEKR